MKYAQADSAPDMLHKIESIEKELIDLKLSVLRNLVPSAKKIVKLKGILKGVAISDEDILAAKKSLYSRTKI